MRIRTFIITTLLLITSLHFTKAQKFRHALSFDVNMNELAFSDEWEIDRQYGGWIGYGFYYNRDKVFDIGINVGLISKKFAQYGKEDEEYNNIKLLTRLNCFRTQITINRNELFFDKFGIVDNVEYGLFLDFILDKDVNNMSYGRKSSSTNLYRDHCWGVNVMTISYLGKRRKIKYNLFKVGILVGFERTFNFIKSDYSINLITFKVGLRLKLNNKTLKRMLR